MLGLVFLALFAALVTFSNWCQDVADRRLTAVTWVLRHHTLLEADKQKLVEEAKRLLQPRSAYWAYTEGAVFAPVRSVDKGTGKVSYGYTYDTSNGELRTITRMVGVRENEGWKHIKEE